MIASNANVHILVIGSSAYDLRQVVRWSDISIDVTSGNETASTDGCSVYFDGMEIPVKIDRAIFEAAKLASLAAGG